MAVIRSSLWPKSTWALTPCSANQSSLTLLIFMDGNKRIALTVAAVFLELSGYSLDATEAEAVLMYRQLAAGAIPEEELANWLRDSTISDA